MTSQPFPVNIKPGKFATRNLLEVHYLNGIDKKL